MISRKLTIDSVEYIVRAKTLAQLDQACQQLENCKEVEGLEEELNREFDQLLSRIEDGELIIPSQPAIEITAEIKSESKFQERLAEEKAKLTKKPSTPKPKPAPKTPTKRQPTDNKTVNLGGMGKQG